MQVIEFWSKGQEAFRFLSNFHPCQVHYKGVVFSSAEHAYHWEKLANKEDFNLLESCSAAEIKKKISSFKKVENWEQIKIGLMRDITKAKFDQNADLRKKLMKLYLEGSVFVHEIPWKDTFWGSYQKIGLNMQGSLISQYAFELLKEKVGIKQRVLNQEKRAFYVGRPSKFGNPFVLKESSDIDERYEVIKKFALYLSEQDTLLKDLAEVKDRQVSCFCAPLDCHADILLCAQWICEQRGLESCKSWLRAFSVQGYSWDPPDLRKKETWQQDDLF